MQTQTEICFSGQAEAVANCLGQLLSAIVFAVEEEACCLYAGFNFWQHSCDENRYFD